MASIPEVFRKAPEFVVNYSYTDISSGTGYQIFYAADGTDINFLLENPVYSNTVVEYVQVPTYDGNFAKYKDLDFDVQFNLPKTIKGRAIINLSAGIANKAAEANEIYVIAKIRKWDGSTETEIANNQSDTFTSGIVINTTYSTTFCIEIDVSETQIKAGEYLRLTIELYGRLGSGAGNAFIGFGHDPKDREDIVNHPNTNQVILDSDTTKLEFHVPFKLNV